MSVDRDAGTALVQGLAAAGTSSATHARPATPAVSTSTTTRDRVLQADGPARGRRRGRRRGARRATTRAPRGARCRCPSGWRSCTASPTCSTRHDDEAVRDQRARQRHAGQRDAVRAYTAAWTRYYAGWVDKLDGEVVPVAGDALDYVLPEPYGVIGAIVPWNGPMMGMGQKAVPALAAGNTVVAKPPEIAPVRRAALRRARARGRAAARRAQRRRRRRGRRRRARAPPGRRQGVVHRRRRDRAAGDGGRGRDADAARLRARRQVGQHRLPRRRPRRRASMAAMLGAVLLSGQGCALPTRLYVHDDVYDEVVGARRRPDRSGARSAIRSTRRSSWARSCTEPRASASSA